MELDFLIIFRLESKVLRGYSQRGQDCFQTLWRAINGAAIAKARLLGAALPKRNSRCHCKYGFSVSLAVVDGDVSVFCPGHGERRVTIFGQVAGHTCILQMSRLACTFF